MRVKARAYVPAKMPSLINPMEYAASSISSGSVS
ncbi:hypothetical protein APX70_200028 [Pseudomonas syringae pv. maculicola]|uniref:Uncharacterized protein n=1 Tax=Pseudomonas syringae pv. maculicola TaxID=59511 RepID=A0A3M2ZZ47_PSEYM|nr:hypothetical protein APX70_200028 [Pseudomonas syringae pv. maculicola]